VSTLMSVENNQKAGGLKLAFFQLTLLLISLSLIVDSINGFFRSGMGFDPKLSATYKLLLLVIILYQIGTYSFKSLYMLLILILLFMIGPTLTFVETLDVSGLIADFIAALKIITSLVIFTFCVLVCKYWPHLVLKYGKWCCQFSFVVLVGNLCLGILGYGFSSYGKGALASMKTAGIKGFFYAGNEVSGIFIILFGIVLHQAWQRKNKIFYYLFVPIMFSFGFLIATKAAMLTAAVLAFSIPMFNERNRLLNLTKLKFKLLAPVFLLIIFLIFTLVPILESIGIWYRFAWFYEKKGLIGIILSGRDEYIRVVGEGFYQFGDIAKTIFGMGRSGIGLFAKESVEVDPADMYFWFGSIGALFYVFLLTLYIRISYLATKEINSQWGPSILVINITLFAVSLFAGHIVTSGMLGPLFGLVNGMAYADYCLNKRDNPGKVMPL